MFYSRIVFGFVVVSLCVFQGCLFKQIPDYIDVCKRDQSTIDECVRRSVERLRPKLAAPEGIPELNVPSIEPFIIPELVVDSGDLIQFKAIGKDVKVFGIGNFTIKNIHVDVDTFTIRARVRIPKLHFDGRYTLDARLLVVPLQGQGRLVADAIKCEAELLVKSKFVTRAGVEYLKFESMSVDIDVKDYRIRLDGLFNGDKTLGDAANEAINQSRGEFLRGSKPYVERTAAKLLLDIANKIASSFPLDDLVPKA